MAVVVLGLGALSAPVLNMELALDLGYTQLAENLGVGCVSLDTSLSVKG